MSSEPRSVRKRGKLAADVAGTKTASIHPGGSPIQVEPFEGLGQSQRAAQIHRAVPALNINDKHAPGWKELYRH